MIQKPSKYILSSINGFLVKSKISLIKVTFEELRSRVILDGVYMLYVHCRSTSHLILNELFLTKKWMFPGAC